MPRSINYRLSANVSGWVRGLDKAADKTQDARREVSALERRLKQLSASSAEPRVNLDTDEAKRRLTDVQARLARFGSKVAEAKARVDDADSQAKISRIESQLLRLGAQTARPDVDLAGVAAAESDLAMLESRLQRFDGNDYRAQVHIDGTMRASRNMLNLLAFGLALGPTIVPAAAAASGAMLGLASAGTVAAAGAGASSLAFLGVGDALKAMSNAETASASNAADMAQKQVTSARQVADAKRTLARAVQQQRYTQVDAAASIADAERELARTRQDAAADVAEAERGVTDARRRAADLVQSAQQRLADATRRVRDAQRDAWQAQQDLTRARQEARRAVRDLREEVGDLALSEEGAEIALIEARRELRKLGRDNTATSLDVRKARLRVAEAEDRLSDVRRDQRETTRDLNVAEKAGIAQSPAVADAGHRVAEANRRVADAKRDRREAQHGVAEAERQGALIVAKAKRGVAEAERQAARDIADARRGVAEARRQAARQQRQAAQQVADAQRGVKRALADMNRTMGQSSSEMETLRQKMSALSPAGRHFVRFLFSLEPKLRELQRIAQQGLFPGVEAGIRELLELFPTLKRLVHNSSTTMGDLAREAGKALTSPFWKDFFNWVAAEAGPKLDKFGHIAGNTATGFAGMARHSDQMGDNVTNALLRMSRRFKNWGKTLDENKQFQQFVRYVNRVSPKAWRTLKSIADALLALAQAAAPVGEFTLPIIRALARAFAAVMRSPAGPVIVGIASAVGLLSRAIRTYDIVKNSRIVGILRNMGGSAGRARGRLGRLAGFIGAGGPWGLAISGAVTVIGILLAKHAQWRQDIEGISATLDTQTGKITRNTRQWVINRLAKNGTLKTAQKLGVNLGLVVRAAMGERDAVAKVNRQLRHNKNAHHDVTMAGGEMRVSTSSLTHEESRLLRQLGGTNKRLKQAQRETRLKAKATRQSRTATQRARVAEDRWKRAIDRATKAVADNNGTVNRHSREFRQDRKAVDHAAKAAGGHIDKMIQSGRTLHDVTQAGKNHRQQLRRVAHQLGLTRDETQRLIDKYNLTPKDIRTYFHAHTRKAKHQAKGLRQYINRQMNDIDNEKWIIDGKIAIGLTHPHHAKGGYIQGPGTSTSDSIPARLSSGEFVQRASAVKREGPAAMQALNEGRATITPRFARGGPVNEDVHLTPIVRRTGVDNVAGRVEKAFLKRVRNSFGGMARASGTYGVGRWADEAAIVLRMLGQPTSLVPYVLRLISKESGGNPGAINLWDVNAIRGTPSKGLIQTIDPTFYAYNSRRLPPNPFNPLANLYAGLNYAIHRYGSLTDPDIYVGGYKDGSWRVPRTGLATIHQGEMVIPRELAQVIRSVPRAVHTMARGGDGASVVNNYYVTTTPAASAEEIIRETLHVARVQRAAGRA